MDDIKSREGKERVTGSIPVWSNFIPKKGEACSRNGWLCPTYLVLDFGMRRPLLFHFSFLSCIFRTWKIFFRRSLTHSGCLPLHLGLEVGFCVREDDNKTHISNKVRWQETPDATTQWCHTTTCSPHGSGKQFSTIHEDTEERSHDCTLPQEHK